MKIALGSDHAGFAYKEAIKAWLLDHGHEVVDFGTDSDARCDYPAFIRPAAEAVARGQADRAVVLGGSGNGEAMVANRVRGVRCAVAWCAEAARLGRAHNDANAISFGQRLLALEDVLEMLKLFLETPFDGGRHARRVQGIEAPDVGA